MTIIVDTEDEFILQFIYLITGKELLPSLITTERDDGLTYKEATMLEWERSIADNSNKTPLIVHKSWNGNYYIAIDPNTKLVAYFNNRTYFC
jgi:hypothetical protein